MRLNHPICYCLVAGYTVETSGIFIWALYPRGLRSRPVGSRSEAPAGSLGDEVPRSWSSW